MRLKQNFATVLVSVGLATPGLAQGVDTMYAPGEMMKDAARLRTAVTKIYELGIKPHLKPRERESLDRVRLSFPRPKPGDDVLNFYAAPGSTPTVFLPVLSLKVLEDMTTAYAWLHQNNYSLSTIDLYFAMLRYRKPRGFPGGKIPGPLTALGIPADALDDKKVDALALGLRNEAFAFLLLHELGHIYFAHKGYAEITKARARADEVQSDRFALDILARTKTPPLGAALFFQAQAYRLPHKGEFPSKAAWNDYLQTLSTHPLTVDRIRHQAEFIRSAFARRRADEKAIWTMVGIKLAAVADMLEDGELQACVAKMAEEAPLDLLKPRPDVAAGATHSYCRDR